MRLAADCGVASAELLALVEAFLELGANAAVEDPNGITLLFLVAVAPHRQLHAANFRRLVLALAAAGAPVNEPHPLAEVTPLMLLLRAALESHAPLLGHGAGLCSASCLIEAFAAAGADLAPEQPVPLLHIVLAAAADLQPSVGS